MKLDELGENCSVWGCKEHASIWWPLVGNIGLCHKHYADPPKGCLTELVRKSKEPPDDFDIPY